VKAISHYQVNLFVDDTLLSVSASTVVECIEKMQEDLDYGSAIHGSFGSFDIFFYKA
jgi:hypothetical protein